MYLIKYVMRHLDIVCSLILEVMHPSVQQFLYPRNLFPAYGFNSKYVNSPGRLVILALFFFYNILISMVPHLKI